MSGTEDSTALAVARLEAALDRLAEALSRWRAEQGEEGVPRAEVAALSARLDETLSRLRAALEEAEG